MVNELRPFDALIASDSASALRWYERRRDDLRAAPIHLHDWARLLCSLGRRSEAEPLFDQLASLDEYAMFVAGQRLIASLEAGASLEQALRQTPLGSHSGCLPAISAATTEFDISRRPLESRHIAICGVSFCGSTLLDMLLEGLPGVASIGESVWLTLSFVDGRSVPRNHAVAHGPGVQECNCCGPRCEFLTPNFRNALWLNPTDWYFRIAERLDTRILVSADKNLEKIVVFDPQLRFQALVVFKSPKHAWASVRSKMKNDLAPEASFEEMTKYMAVWKRVYSEMVGAFKPRDGKVFLDFDRFAEAPEANFRSLTAALDLEYDPTALVRPSPGHSLGGNGAAFRRVRDADYRVDVRPLGEPAIPDDHAAWIDSQVDITELHATMRRLSEEREALLI